MTKPSCSMKLTQMASAVSRIEAKCQSLHEETNKKIDEAVAKFESLGAELKKSIDDLRTETHSFHTQYNSHFLKELQAAQAIVFELTTALSASAIKDFATQLQESNAVMVANVVDKLKCAIRPILQLSNHMRHTRSSQQGPRASALTGPSFQSSQGEECLARGPMPYLLQ